MSERRGPIGWVVVETMTNREGAVVQRHTVTSLQTTAERAGKWLGQEWTTARGTRYTYTVEPVGIGGAPDEALRLREALEPFARLLGEIESGDPAITHYDDGYLFAVYDANGMLGELSAADLRCAARALAREATEKPDA